MQITATPSAAIALVLLSSCGEEPASRAQIEEKGSWYEGTCLEAAYECLDYSLPCTQDSREDGFTIRYASGATFQLDFTAGVESAHRSSGESCWTAHFSPNEPDGDLTVETSRGTVRVRRATGGHEITCPDGSATVVKGPLATPWVEAVNECSLVGENGPPGPAPQCVPPGGSCEGTRDCCFGTCDGGLCSPGGLGTFGAPCAAEGACQAGLTCMPQADTPKSTVRICTKACDTDADCPFFLSCVERTAGGRSCLVKP